VLHSFNVTGGAYPEASLIFDASGSLYGTTYLGGTHNDGTVFKLAPDSQGGWNEKILFSFQDRPGAFPEGNLIFGSLGHLYGTTAGDNKTTFGSVFEITP